MKILNLKFKNINSLSGENEIDFTKPIFTDSGLFAITGKTGSGKSSILDAISLAFYGETSRAKITGSENEVMTKGEKDCYSEIIFEVAGKKWKSSWKQELNSNGKLKPVKRIIADSNDKIIADQVSSCDIKIVDIIGLSFGQFTKVIMLAQGSFAVFLESNKNNKGELLEKITGTEIYGLISGKVFVRNKIENAKLDKILIEFNAIKILSKEEIENLDNEIGVSEKDKKQIDAELVRIEIAKKWFTELENLENQINVAKDKFPELEEKTKKAKIIFDKSETTLKTVKDEQKIQEPIFRKVRELDTKISEKEKLLQPILKAISETDSNKNELSSTLEKQNKDLDSSNILLIEKHNWAIENKKYEDLVSNYSAIENENQLLVASLNEIKELNSEIVYLQKDFESKQSNSKKATKDYTEKEKNLVVKTNEHETKKSELEKVLGGKDISELQSKKENLANLCRYINNLIDNVKAISANKKKIDKIDEEINTFSEPLKILLEKIDIDKKGNINLKSKIDLLDENIKLTKTIQSLEEHRNKLKDGEECPLCGSLEHPFAKDNIPQIGEKEKELIVLKNKHQGTTTTIQQDEIKLAKLDSNNKNALDNKEKEKESLEENNEKQKEILIEIKNLKLNYNIPKEEKKIEEILTEKQNEHKKVSILIEEANNCENKLKNLRDKEIPALEKEKNKTIDEKTEAELAQKLAEQQLKGKQDSASEIQKKYNSDKITFIKKLENYGVESIEALKKCLNAWNANKKQTDELTNQITTLKSNIAVNNKGLEGLINSFKEKQKETEDIENDKQKLSDEIKKIFSEKSVDEVESRLNKLLEDSEAEKTKSEKEKNDTNTEIEKNRAIVTEKEKEFLKIQKQKITEKSIAELQEESIKKKKEADDLSQKIGANNQTLKSNAENLNNSSNKQKEKEKQEAICSKWGNINELIGSADGKKYRNFAQALTFEHLIGLSNKQLQKMSDRYILKRTGDIDNPFELSVIDIFQNSVERTVNNLSGGEKFILSLSLALGLSNMASKNMRIDTMFIDEGFGTLDSGYLDVALNVLSNLQSEGKIIGVISHLTELKERITTHIEIVQSGNGYSKIQITN